jgi:hypothetical protein
MSLNKNVNKFKCKSPFRKFETPKRRKEKCHAYGIPTLELQTATKMASLRDLKTGSMEHLSVKQNK